jgi:ABC-2 type transport system ATP-binding protein
LKNKGASILFSTHRMEQVEEICEDIVLINKGKIILYGGVNSIKNDFKEHKFSVKYTGDLPNQMSYKGYDIISSHGNEIIFMAQNGQSSNDLLKSLIVNDINIISFNEILPSLNEIFITKVASSNE